MGHRLVLVLVANPRAEVAEQVEAVIGRHGSNATVPPYKLYFKPCHWNGRLWREGDAEAFARRWEEVCDQKYERDDNGYYRWTDRNPDPEYDWYTFGGNWNGIFAGRFVGASSEKDGIGGRIEGNVCPVGELPGDLSPAAIATPDGQWHHYSRRPWDDEDLPPPIREIVERYRDQYALAVPPPIHEIVERYRDY
jgi:hypothetical protein